MPPQSPEVEEEEAAVVVVGLRMLLLALFLFVLHRMVTSEPSEVGAEVEEVP
jgi:uncharacterized membrane protein YadS